MSEGNYSYDVMYGADGDRIRSRLYEDSILSKTKYYAPGYEKIIKSGSTIENHYIVSPYGLEAIIAKTGTSETLYLAETDHLGSLVGLFNTSGIHVEQYSYDAWGRRRNPADLTFINVPVPVITERGFTGHEHLDEFRLINMNGRLYDPLTGRFLNSDPVIDNTGGAQGLNSYTYVLNNPLRYTDPSGYIKTAPPEPGVILNPGWLRYAGYGHHSSSWFLQEFEAGKNGTGAEDRVKFEGILYDQETDTYVKGDGTPLSDEEILDYMFSLLEPTNGIEPQGQGGNISLYFDGNRLHIVDESTGSGVYNTIAYSGKGEGMNNPAFQDKEDFGTIPEGNYSFTMDGIQTISTRNRILGLVGRGEWRGGTGSWGDTRVWLTPGPYTGTYGRDGFTIHGGSTPGSRGCLDLVGNNNAFFDALRGATGSQNIVILRVRY
jgi:RHS repeat-associated protein